MIFPFKPAFCLGILQQAMTGTSPRHPFERRAASESVTGVREKPKMLWKKPQNQQNRASMDIIGYNGIFGARLTKVIQLYHQLYININKWNKRGRKTATYECLRNTPKPWVYRCIFWMILVSLVFLRKPHVLKLEPTKWKLCYRAISEFGGVKEPGIIMPCPVQIRFNGDGEQFESHLSLTFLTSKDLMSL